MSVKKREDNKLANGIKRTITCYPLQHLDQFEKWLVRWNNTGHEIYLPQNKIRRAIRFSWA